MKSMNIFMLSRSYYYVRGISELLIAWNTSIDKKTCLVLLRTLLYRFMIYTLILILISSIIHWLFIDISTTRLWSLQSQIKMPVLCM